MRDTAAEDRIADAAAAVVLRPLASRALRYFVFTTSIAIVVSY